MMPFMRRLARGFCREDGTASMEFALSIPVLLTVFMASFESGLLMTRSIMLEQAVDRTMRELRLGHYPLVDLVKLKEEICARTVIFRDCADLITIDMTRVATGVFVKPNYDVGCVDRDDEDFSPVTALQIGQQNDVMLVRVCIIQEALLPGTGIGLGLSEDDSGGYRLVTVSAFVTEPN